MVDQIGVERGGGGVSGREPRESRGCCRLSSSSTAVAEGTSGMRQLLGQLRKVGGEEEEATLSLRTTTKEGRM